MLLRNASLKKEDRERERQIYDILYIVAISNDVAT